jgi:predicted DNA repair protein MutK
MASGFFAVFDDVATLLDDVATMSKVAGKKTAGLLGDDLAVNAEKASGFASARELPVLWAITKGSLINKLIILPVAFLLSAFLPSVITLVLLLGGFYLAYEGAEKVFEYFVPHKKPKQVALKQTRKKAEILKLEKQKIRSAILTDFILSVEIVIIALSSVDGEPLKIQIVVVSIIALLATVGVYGLVALIVRMDDLGLVLISLNQEHNSFSYKMGNLLVRALPKVVKGLTFIGTIALMLVSGGIFVHHLPFVHHLAENVLISDILFEFLTGIVIGAVVLAIMKVSQRVFIKIKR